MTRHVLLCRGPRSSRPACSALILLFSLSSLVFPPSAEAQVVSPAPSREAQPAGPLAPLDRRFQSAVSAELSAPSAAVDAANADKTRAELFAELDAEVSEFERYTRILRKVVQLARPSVVHIESRPSAVSEAGRRATVSEEAGSGVVVELSGGTYVITNRHVVLNAAPRQIFIHQHDGTRLTAQAVHADPATDVAVIRVAESGAVAARIGDSDETDIGDFVLAVGSPFGLSHSVTYGIISATGRRDLELGSQGVRLQDFLQTDAAVNPGNSGGPLINLRGEVVGINTAIASSSGGSEGIGFAIPINMVMVVARQLAESGVAAHAYLGVRLEDDYGPELARRWGIPYSQGALVKSVTPNSPAARAQLRRNDLIVRFNQLAVEDDVHLVNLVSLTPIGKVVTLRVIRDGNPLDVQLRVGDRSEFEQD